jgi:hypothetical protein
MSSVYTNIAKKRIEQSSQADTAPQTQSAEQPTTVSPTPKHEKIDEKPEKELKSPQHDVTTSPRHDANHRKWRDIIEDTEVHNSALRLTNEERFDVEDLISELRRKYKIKTSMNEIARLGLLYIIDDFKKDKPNALIIKVKKS